MEFLGRHPVVWFLGLLALAGGYAFFRRTRDYDRVAKELRSPLSRFRSFSVRPSLLSFVQSSTQRATQPEINIHVEMRQVASSDGEPITVYIYRHHLGKPGGAVMLYTHGGGMIAGSAQLFHDRVSAYARDLHITIVSPNYRLAPQHPFPAPLDDIHATYRWLIAEASSLEIDASRIVVTGDSAGGGLTAALCQRIRDAGEPAPILQLLVYPMLDDRSALTPEDICGQIGWTRKSNAYAWSSYLGHPAGEANPARYAVPAREEDLAGLPPAWIGVGTLDLFHAENVAYAHQLRAAGVACDLVEVEGAFHAFDAMYPKAKIVKEFRNKILQAIRQAIAPPLKECSGARADLAKV
jgi:acetyl esterase/lipase